MKKRYLLLLLTVLIAGALFAQKAEKDSVRHNNFGACKDNWYLEVSAGGNVLFSKETDFVKSDFIRTLNGSLNLITVESSGDSFSSFTGYDGYIYYRYVDYEGKSDQNYYRVNISPDYTINKSFFLFSLAPL